MDCSRFRGAVAAGAGAGAGAIRFGDQPSWDTIRKTRRSVSAMVWPGIHGTGIILTVEVGGSVVYTW